MSIIGRIRAWRGSRTASAGEVPAPFQGYVDEISAHHVAGWVTGPAPGRFEAVLPGGEVVGHGAADQFKFGPSHEGLGHHGFFARLSRALTEAEQDALILRANDGTALPRAEYLVREYRPVMLNAMDIVNNCNLRCPFCVYDYANTNATYFMDEATLEAVLRFLPYTGDSNFWFSCLHEPTLHPDFMAFLDRVPAAWRRKVFFTTNLAKRMRPEYFRFLADGGFANVNISIESLDQAIYERMRKGARQRIFLENWDALMAALAEGAAPPFLRYIVMVYKSNLAEIPSLVEHLLAARRADEIQLRFTFDVPHIPQEFRESEYVSAADWDWLTAQMAHHPAEKVKVIRNPAAEAPPAPAAAVMDEGAPAEKASAGIVLPGRFEFQTSWDGTIKVKRYWAVPFDTSGEPPILEINAKDIADPLAFFASLPG
jgi:molybdenum cofactor biosynthesis enzyme MoaA